MRVLRGFQRSRKKPRSGRGFHSVRAKLMFCALIRGLQNLDSPFGKGFNFVSAWSLFGCADSRFVEPRSSLRGSTILFFSLVRKEPKVPQRFANLWTPGSDSNLRSIRSFILNDRRSSCNRPYREPQGFRVSTVRI